MRNEGNRRHQDDRGRDELGSLASSKAALFGFLGS
jgi:hypothetical protein